MTIDDKKEIQQPILDLLLWQAVNLATKGRYIEAEQILSTLKTAPNQERAQAADLLAKIRIRQKRFSQALSLWQTALALDPDNNQHQKAINRIPRFKKISAWLPYVEGTVIAGFCVGILLSLYSYNPTERDSLPTVKYNPCHFPMEDTVAYSQPPDMPHTLSKESSLIEPDHTSDASSPKEMEISTKAFVEEDSVLPSIKEEETLNVLAETLIDEPGEISNKTHVIQFGETLSSIARQYFNDSSKFNLLVNANKDRYPSLIDNPHNIRPGWVLVIPNIASEE